MDTLSTAFREYIKNAISLSKAPSIVTGENVYQEGADDILPYLDKMVEELLLPGSGIDGFENLEELYAKAESGKSCLLLPEHYSNLDLSLFSYLVRKTGGRGEAIGRSVIAIAGMKLTEESPVVSAFASAYSRIVIYPSRSLKGLEGEKRETERARSKVINLAAMKALANVKNTGRLVLIFPSGTRYRPGDPATKRGVREIDSYIRSFDYMCFVAINGEVLHIKYGDMMEDAVSQDVVRIGVGPVLSCTEFRGKIMTDLDAKAVALSKEDKKQAVADAIMAELEKMNREGGKRRMQFLK
jgi:glycerol-3-phosphate O-acyltransferase